MTSTLKKAPIGKLSDPFWGDDLSILFDKGRIAEFFPSADQSLPERMNSITRLVMYVSVALAIYQQKSTSIHFGILLMIILYFMWKYQTITSTVKMIADGTLQSALQENFASVNEVSQSTESSQQVRKPVLPQPNAQMYPSLDQSTDTCIMPTKNNPFMNYLQHDGKTRPPACSGPGVQELASNLLDSQLFDDVNDLYSKNGNQRLFRTMPSTNRIPETEKFAAWLVKGNEGCRTTGACAPYTDLRTNRQLIPEDMENEFHVEGFSV